MKLDLAKRSKVAIAAVASLVLLILCASLIACDAEQQRQADAATESIFAADDGIGGDADPVAGIADNEDETEGADLTDPATDAEDALPASQADPGDIGASASGTGAPERSAVQTPQAPQAPESQAQASHAHSWDPITEPYEVIDKHAWVETVYKTVECTLCSVCGEDITHGDSQGRSITAHGKAHALAGEGGGCYSSTKQVPNGTITHDAVTHWDTRTIGYRCQCGAERSA